MLLAVDVSYRDREAIVGGILFRDWVDGEPEREFVLACRVLDKYIPGQFYRRELPCIIAMLKEVAQPVDCIIIDGFVHLGRDRQPGLGKYLRDILDKKTAVIGVAKRPYRDTPGSTEVRRGRSRRPLYVTADGFPEKQAKFLVKNMHGRHRIPTLLKYVDLLCKESAERLTER